ncbi:MAG: hypothetical protein WA771_12110 [Chthoniobacterales bacterium]
MRGTWTGTKLKLKLGNSDPQGHDPKEHADKPEEVRVTPVNFTLTIDFQEGRLFSGTYASSFNSETIVGAITTG